MQIYSFFQHLTTTQTYIKKGLSNAEQQPLFIWIDCVRDDVVQRSEEWQHEILEMTSLALNELHIKDILNLEHPCAFDSMEDYDLLIFRKLMTPDDELATGKNALEQHEHVFGLVTTPVSFILGQHVLITIREQGNKAFENYLARIEMILQRPIDEQNKPRKLAQSALDLSLRLLNCMIDGYLDLRLPLTRRVEYWQNELLERRKRFNHWQQLLKENMAFQQIENLCEEQIECLQELREVIVDEYPQIKSKKKAERQDILLVRMNDLSSHVERIQKHTIRLRSAIQSAMDLHFAAISNQTNENMRILAVITAVFAPLTLLTGIYGMNFTVIPGLESIHGFWIMLLVMSMTTILLLYYFYRQQMVGLGEQSIIEILAQQPQDQPLNLFSFVESKVIKPSMKGALKEVEKLTKF